ncbi:MAG: DUF6428 family protein [Saprospiraceae bacterium]|nr:DUF6428 family protein [Saprospiraceae bacterium]
MTLSEIKSQLPNLNQLKFQLPDGTFVPQHFHITEIGIIHKHFIDCGGTIRNEKTANFQLWQANDFDHRIAPKKLMDIISLSERALRIEDSEQLEIEVEYQSDTIGKYGLAFNGTHFELTTKNTTCLAKDNCSIPPEKLKINLAQTSQPSAGCCAPGSGCC